MKRTMAAVLVLAGGHGPVSAGRALSSTRRCWRRCRPWKSWIRTTWS